MKLEERKRQFSPFIADKHKQISDHIISNYGSVKAYKKLIDQNVVMDGFCLFEDSLLKGVKITKRGFTFYRADFKDKIGGGPYLELEDLVQFQYMEQRMGGRKLSDFVHPNQRLFSVIF